MRPLTMIPEYGPVSKLLLCFVHPFFNTRFAYGPAMAEMVRAARNHVEVVLFVDPEDLPPLEAALANCGLSLGDVTTIPRSSGRAIFNEWCPIFCQDDENQGVALTFPWLSEHPHRQEHQLDRAERFGRWLAEHLGLPQHRMPFDFSGSAVAVCEEFVFVSRDFPAKDGPEEFEQKLAYLRRSLPNQEVLPLPSLTDDTGPDLDTYLLPIGPRSWISSQYPSGTDQAKSVRTVQEELRRRGHTVHLVPGLERIQYDDIDALPGYPESVLLGDAALVPSYGRPEDEAIQGILKDYGLTVYPVDCRQVCLTGVALHGISKTLPASLEI